MFCRHCGNELLDEAVVCPKCGCLVHETETARVETQPVAQTSEQPVVSRKFYRLKKIFSIVGTALSGVALFCAVVFWYLIFLAFITTDDGALGLAILSIFWFYFSVVVSPFALASGILAFVFGGKTEKRGAFATAAFVLGIVAFAATWGAFGVLVTL